MTAKGSFAVLFRCRSRRKIAWENGDAIKVVFSQFTSEKQTHKFLIDAVTLPRSRLFSWLAENLLQPIRSTTQMLVVMLYQYGISMLVPQHHFAGKPVVALQNIDFFLRLGKRGSRVMHLQKILKFLSAKSPLHCQYSVT